MKGYSSANGDNRGILERFLPSTYRTTKDGSNAHNAFLGAIKGSIETTRDDMKDMSLQVYFTKATGKFLDLYGKYVGLSRNENEEDQSYRDRIVKYIQTKRGTIEAIIDGIRNELGEPDLPVSIYETWRNIFIMNKSTLNGLDYIMGEKYRYAVIEITVGKYVEPSILTEIVERYKAYGVKVLYRYALGMSDEVWNDPVYFSQDFIDSDKTYNLVDYTSPYYEKATITLGDSPITEKDISLFKMNNSKLNGSDVVSGNPENAYIFDYTNSPSYHIIGYVDSNSNPKYGGFKDSYDYVYQGTKVDLSTVGGRNLLLGTTGITGSQWSLNGMSNGTYNNATVLETSTSGAIFDYNKSELVSSSKINITDKFMFSLYVNNNSGSDITITTTGGSTNENNKVIATISSGSGWKRVSGGITFWTLSGSNIIGMGVQGIGNQGKVLSTMPKLETGTIATDWSPAPEDTPKLYGYPLTTEPYLITSRKDNNGYEFKPSINKSTVIGVNVSRYAINGGYENLISNYNSSSVNSVNIYTKGSEIGLPRTDLVVVGTDGKNISGNFITNGNSSYVSDNSKSTGAYKFAFSSPKSVDSLTVIDYYNYGYSNRLITISTPKIELPVGIFKGQTTGDIKLPDYSYPDKTFLVSSTNKFKLNIDSTSKGVMIYNYSSQSWEKYDFGKYYEIGNYIEDANSIQGAYMLVKFTDSDFVLNYFGLEFETVTIPYTSDGSTYSNKLGQFVLDQSKLG